MGRPRSLGGRGKSKMANLASSPEITYRTPDMAERSCHDSHAVFQSCPPIPRLVAN